MTETVYQCPRCQRRCTVLVGVKAVYHQCKGQKAAGGRTGRLSELVEVKA